MQSISLSLLWPADRWASHRDNRTRLVFRSLYSVDSLDVTMIVSDNKYVKCGEKIDMAVRPTCLEVKASVHITICFHATVVNMKTVH